MSDPNCNYPNCDGGPATGCCHSSCRRPHSRKELNKLGVPSDMTAEDVMALFSLPDDDDSMHAQNYGAGQGPSK